MNEPVTTQRTASIDPAAETPAAELLARVNALAVKPLSADDVYIRSMYLCSDRVCEADWLRFTPRALAQIARHVCGRSVLAGHNRSSLPLARFFHAVVTAREDAPGRWVRAWFYWLRATAGALDLLRNIDGGVYREVSISWRYRGDTCSVCGAGRHGCDHVPGELYDGSRCHRIVDKIVDVLEGSLVYRGADADACLVGAHGVGTQGADGRSGGLFALDARGAAALAELLFDLPATVERAFLCGDVPPALALACLDLGLEVRWSGHSRPEEAQAWGFTVCDDPLPAIGEADERSLVLLAQERLEGEAGERLAAALPAGLAVLVVGDAGRAAGGVRALAGEWPRKTATLALAGRTWTVARGSR